MCLDLLLVLYTVENRLSISSMSCNLSWWWTKYILNVHQNINKCTFKLFKNVKLAMWSRNPRHKYFCAIVIAAWWYLHCTEIQVLCESVHFITFIPAIFFLDWIYIQRAWRHFICERYHWRTIKKWCVCNEFDNMVIVYFLFMDLDQCFGILLY